MSPVEVVAEYAASLGWTLDSTERSATCRGTTIRFVCGADRFHFTVGDEEPADRLRAEMAKYMRGPVQS